MCSSAFSGSHINRIIQYVAFQTDFFHLAICIKYSTKSLCGLIVHSYLSLNSIPLCGSTTIYLPIHLLKGILVAASSWKLQIELL